MNTIVSFSINRTVHGKNLKLQYLKIKNCQFLFIGFNEEYRLKTKAACMIKDIVEIAFSQFINLKFFYQFNPRIF